MFLFLTLDLDEAQSLEVRVRNVREEHIGPIWRYGSQLRGCLKPRGGSPGPSFGLSTGVIIIVKSPEEKYERSNGKCSPSDSRIALVQRICDLAAMQRLEMPGHRPQQLCVNNPSSRPLRTTAPEPFCRLALRSSSIDRINGRVSIRPM